MPAFELAHRMGADGIELDVQLTWDGKVVVCHDERVDRTSDGMGALRDFTLAELWEMDFSKLHPEQGQTKIPLLSEVLDFMRGTKMVLNIELKTSNVRYPRLEEKTAALVREFGLEERVWYSSFHHESVCLAKELTPGSHTGFLFGQPILEMPSYTKKYGVDAVHLARPLLDVCPNIVRESQAEGLKVHVWVVDNLQDMARMCRLEVDAFFTDCPDNARRVVDDICNPWGREKMGDAAE